MHIAHWQNYVVGGPCVSFLFFSWRAELQAIHCPNILVRMFSDSTVVDKQLSALADEKQWESNIRAIVQHSAAVPGGWRGGSAGVVGSLCPLFPVTLAPSSSSPVTAPSPRCGVVRPSSLTGWSLPLFVAPSSWPFIPLGSRSSVCFHPGLSCVASPWSPASLVCRLAGLTSCVAFSRALLLACLGRLSPPHLPCACSSPPVAAPRPHCC